MDLLIQALSEIILNKCVIFPVRSKVDQVTEKLNKVYQILDGGSMIGRQICLILILNN